MLATESWKFNTRVGDLGHDQYLEAVCTSCGFIHRMTKANICVSPEREFLNIKDLERDCVCRAQGCYGRVQITLIDNKRRSHHSGG